MHTVTRPLSACLTWAPLTSWAVASCRRKWRAPCQPPLASHQAAAGCGGSAAAAPYPPPDTNPPHTDRHQAHISKPPRYFLLSLADRSTDLLFRRLPVGCGVLGRASLLGPLPLQPRLVVLRRQLHPEPTKHHPKHQYALGPPTHEPIPSKSWPTNAPPEFAAPPCRAVVSLDACTYMHGSHQPLSRVYAGLDAPEPAYSCWRPPRCPYPHRRSPSTVLGVDGEDTHTLVSVSFHYEL